MHKTTHRPSTRDIEELARLAREARGEYGRGKTPKSEFRRLGFKILRALAAELGLDENAYDLRFQPGGPAGSGESVLHADTVYVQFCQDTGYGLMFRGCRSRTDYTGKTNQWWPYARLADWDGFVSAVRKAGASAPAAAPLPPLPVRYSL